MKGYKLLLIILNIFLSGCSWLGVTATITVRLPDIPEHWSENRNIDSFKLIYRDISGSPISISIPIEEKTVVIEIPKIINFPILAYTDEISRPAGGIFPLHINQENELELNWENGLSASVFTALLQNEERIEAVNSSRLCKEIIKKGEGDPWSLDIDSIISGLLYNQFRAGKIKKLPVIDINIPASQGIWISGNPFHLAYTVEETEGNLILTEIYKGFHIFYKQESTQIIKLHITENEWLIINTDK